MECIIMEIGACGIFFIYNFITKGERGYNG